MPTATDTTANTPEVSTEPKAIDFGNGRYSPLMEECFHDSMTIFKLSNEKAEKLARQIGSEIGALMRNAPVTVKTGNPNKDGRMTLSEAAKMKNVNITYPIMALRAMQWANEAGKNGFSRKTTKWSPIEQMVKYFEEL